MVRFDLGFVAALGLCVVASAGFAQSSQTAASPPSPADGDAKPAASGDVKPPAKKTVHKAAKASVTSLRPANPTANLKPYTPSTSFGAADEAAKAARLEEGRKKFFEQSSGFDNTLNFETGPGSSAPGASSSSPAALGLKF